MEMSKLQSGGKEMTCFICEKEKAATVSIDGNVYYMLCSNCRNNLTEPEVA